MCLIFLQPCGEEVSSGGCRGELEESAGVPTPQSRSSSCIVRTFGSEWRVGRRRCAGIVFQTGRPTLARYGPARRGPTLCGPMTSSGRAVSCIVPNYRPRHDPMAYFSGRAGTTQRMARWATAGPALSCEAATDRGRSAEAGALRARASRGRRPTLVEAAPRRRTPGAPVPAAEAAQAGTAKAPAPMAAGGGNDQR
jgi:hypothetical protein